MRKNNERESSPQKNRKGSRRKKHPFELKGRSLFLALLLSFGFGFESSYMFFEGRQEKNYIAYDTEKSASSEDPMSEVRIVDKNKSQKAEYSNDEKAMMSGAERILENMTIEEKIYQLFFVTQEQLTDFNGVVIQSGSATQTAIQRKPVGGIVYFEDNLQSPDQVKRMISSIQSYSKLRLFIAVDEEGGRVARFGSNSNMNTTAIPPMLEVGREGEKAVRSATSTIGEEIAKYGVNLDFAPVADVFNNPDNTVIGDRALSNNGYEAAQLVASAVHGFQDSQMLCTLKHFPGHGNTSGDSHTDAVYTDKTLQELKEEEFLPFETGIEAGAEFVMVGHICTPKITDSYTPATFSHLLISDVLRKELGFKGIVITDAMNMSAITNYYNSDEAAVLAIQAGVDMILMPASLENSVEALKKAVDNGTITEERINESVLRILATKIEHGLIRAY